MQYASFVRTLYNKGVADAGVNGGMRNFAPFYTDDYLQHFPDQKSDLKQLSSLIVEILDLVYDSILLTRNALPFSSDPDNKSKELLEVVIVERYIDQVSSYVLLTMFSFSHHSHGLLLNWAILYCVVHCTVL